METSVGQVVHSVVIDLDGVGTVSVLTTNEAAARLGYTTRHIRLMCDMGQLIGIKFAGRWWVLERHVNRIRQRIDNATA